MAGTAHLDVRDVTGDRRVPINANPFTIGRRETNDLRLGGTEVSREHAEITRDGDRYTLHDRGSRYGTFVNDLPVTAQALVLVPGDRIRLGRSGGGAELVFGPDDVTLTPSHESLSTPFADIRQMAALFEGLRAIGPRRVLHDVLALVLDSAIAVSDADRGFIMLASPEGALEFTLARGRDKVTLDDAPFRTSRKFPEAAFSTGQIQIEENLSVSERAADHPDTAEIGILWVLCMPLHRLRIAEATDADDRPIGVLYLDSQTPGPPLSATIRGGLEALADRAAIAIENARLYREAAEKIRMEQDLRIAAEIQSLLLPRTSIERPSIEAAAASLPCRLIGGDFFDYADLGEDGFAFTLGDVAGKGPPAALLSALLQGMFSLAVEDRAAPASVVSRMNGALCRRGIEARFATLFHGVLDVRGRLVYCNGGHNPPFVVGPSGVRRLETGGPVVGLLNEAVFDDGVVQLVPGDRIVVFSDGVSEALSTADELFGDDGILALLESVQATSSDLDATSVVEALIAAVGVFTNGTPQGDDITAMVVRYLG